MRELPNLADHICNCVNFEVYDPEIFGKYSQEELDKIIKGAHKNGYTMIYGGRTKNNKLNVRKEMKRINEMKEKKRKKKVLSKKKGSTKKGSTKKGKK